MNNPSNSHVPIGAEPLAVAVHRSLLAGLIVSGLLLIAGLLASFVQHQLNQEFTQPNLASLLREAMAGDGAAVLDLGLLALLFTPICRVLVLAIGWTIERDRRMAMVATFVLFLLAVSLYLGAK